MSKQMWGIYHHKNEEWNIDQLFNVEVYFSYFLIYNKKKFFFSYTVNPPWEHITITHECALREGALRRGWLYILINLINKIDHNLKVFFIIISD